MRNIYFAQSDWRPIENNPFTTDGAYGESWSAFIYDESIMNSYTNFYPKAKVYTVIANPRQDKYFHRLIDFVHYETSKGRNIIINIPHLYKKNIIEKLELTENRSPNIIRSSDPRWVVHSTTKQSWSEIKKIGSLLSPSELRRNNKKIHEIGLKAMLEPEDYSDYVMFDMLDGCGEIVVSSRQLGYVCLDTNIEYVPGFRLYFDAHKIITDGLAVRDGLHIIKVFKGLPLEKYMVMSIDSSMFPKQKWTPNSYTYVTNKYFLSYKSLI